MKAASAAPWLTISVSCPIVSVPAAGRYALTVDVLSDTIAVMRTGRPHSAQIRKCAPWGVRAEPFHGAGFHVVLEGTCWLVPADGAPIALGPGDVVCLPHGRGHALADSLTTPLTDVPSASLAAIRP